MPTESSPISDRLLTFASTGSRAEQEDAAVCLSNPKAGTALVVVCDGVGGSSDGGAASQVAVQQAALFWKQQGEMLPHPAENLSSLVRQIHDRIRNEGESRNISPRTTMVALYLDPQGGYWAHSGDSRLYHFRKGLLLTRTRDHSVVEILVQQGAVQEKEMGSHPDQGRLLQSLGGPDYKQPAQGSAETTPDDAFLLCTDGFWERTKSGEMAKILYSPRCQSVSLLQQAVERAARRNGSKSDNLTVAIALPQRESSTRPQGNVAMIAFYLLFAIVVILLIGWFLFFGGAHH